MSRTLKLFYPHSNKLDAKREVNWAQLTISVFT